MNSKIILFFIGRLMQMNSLFLLAPLAVSFIYQEPPRYILSFLVTALMSGIVGSFFSRKSPKRKKLRTKESFVIVSLSWIVLSFIGAFPFVISGDVPSFVDAFFESTSGFTTTGMSILDNASILSRSNLFWRSFTQFLGGIGVLVFALAIVPSADSEYVHVLKAEITGPKFGKVLPKISKSTRYLFYIYLGLTVATIILLNIFGMPIFDSLIYAFGVAATGGFGMFNGDISVYNSVAIEVILAIAMFLFGINFNLYFLTLTKHLKQVFKSEELKWYIGFAVVATVLITLNLSNVYNSFPQAFHNSFFSVTSMISSTGIEIMPLQEWPTFSRSILLLLMMMGGMVGSTSGGFKVSRVVIMIKTLFAEIKRNIYPNRVVSIHFENEALDEDTVKATTRYLIVYLAVFIMVLLYMTLEFPTLSGAFNTVVGTFNNIGLTLSTFEEGVTIAGISPVGKTILSFAMITGRLEIYPILILLSPSVWRRHT